MPYTGNSKIRSQSLCPPEASNPAEEEDAAERFLTEYAEGAWYPEEVSGLWGSFPGKDGTRAEDCSMGWVKSHEERRKGTG